MHPDAGTEVVLQHFCQALKGKAQFTVEVNCDFSEVGLARDAIDLHRARHSHHVGSDIDVVRSTGRRRRLQPMALDRFKNGRAIPGTLSDHSTAERNQLLRGRAYDARCLK
jgi:hypothetical protein